MFCKFIFKANVQGQSNLMRIFGKNGNIGLTLKGTEGKVSIFLSDGDLNLLFY